MLAVEHGRNLDDVGVTLEEAEYILENDILNSIESLKKYKWFLELNAPRQVAIIDMLFDLGLPKLLSFKKMINALNEHDYETAAKEMLDSKWARQVGDRAKELAKIVETGEI